MGKKTAPQSHHDSDNSNLVPAQEHAMALLNRRACSTAKLVQKLEKLYPPQAVQTAIEFCTQHKLLDDLTLCKETALMQVQRKAHSKTQLQVRLYSYGFNQQTILESLEFVRLWHKNLDDKLAATLGGVFLDAHVQVPAALSDVINTWDIWQWLCISALVNIQATRSCSPQTAVQRLCLRGYTRTQAQNALLLTGVDTSV